MRRSIPDSAKQRAARLTSARLTLLSTICNQRNALGGEWVLTRTELRTLLPVLWDLTVDLDAADSIWATLFPDESVSKRCPGQTVVHEALLTLPDAKITAALFLIVLSGEWHQPSWMKHAPGMPVLTALAEMYQVALPEPEEAPKKGGRRGRAHAGSNTQA